MPAGRLTDVPGVRVGHVTDAVAGSGCTVILPAPGMVGAAHATGGGVSSRETELIGPRSRPREVTALVFSGGSAFGLATADGVMRWCEEQGLGLATGGGAVVPIVPGAVIYDLGISSNGFRPGSNEGYRASQVASSDTHAVGSVGAGTGATVGKWHARNGWCKGGLGGASRRLTDGTTVGVLAVVNAFGDVLAEDGTVLAGARGPDGRFIGASAQAHRIAPHHPRLSGANTTLLCVATDAPVGALGAAQLARGAFTGAARSIAPVGTVLDGDIAFGLAAPGDADPFIAAVVAAECAASAIRCAVRAATEVRGVRAIGS